MKKKEKKDPIAKEDKRQAVETLKDQEWFNKAVIKGGLGMVVMGQAVSSLQIFIEDSKYYAEFGSSQRAGVPEFNVPVKPYDVAASSNVFSEEVLRKAVMAILVEKIKNDLSTVEALIERMKKDGIIDQGFESITLQDIAEATSKK